MPPLTPPWRAPDPAPEPPQPGPLPAPGRRGALGLMGASLALAAAGCDGPDEFGHPLYAPARGVVAEDASYATVLDLDGLGRGVLVRTRAGHAVKVEGNPAHPASLGATDIFAESAVLSLHDPARSRRVRLNGRPRPAGELDAALAAARAEVLPRGGAGLRLLTGPVSSPTVARLIQGVLDAYPGAVWHQHDPLADDAALAGSVAAFGRPVAALPDFARARAVLCLGADPLGAGPAQLRWARDWSAGRAAGRAAGRLPELVVAESTPGLTGAKATRRLPMTPGEIEAFARAVAAGLHVPGLAAGGGHPEAAGVAALLRAAGPGGAMVLAGRGQPAAVHALAHATNAALGAPMRLAPHPLARPEPMAEALRGLVAAMAAGEVTHLVVLGPNPAYDAPAALGFVEALRRVGFTAHLGTRLDETAQLCRWHAPLLHPLEAWGDSRAFDGTPALRQPATVPLVPEARDEAEVLAVLLGAPPTAREAVAQTWRAAWGEAGFEARWAAALEAGVADAAPPALDSLAPRPDWDRPGPAAPASTAPASVAPASVAPASVAPASVAPASVAPAPGTTVPGTTVPGIPAPGAAPAVELSAPSPAGLWAVFAPDPGVRAGAEAQDAWLQELPRPLTKIVWGNAALLAPETAAGLGLAPGDEVELALGGRRVLAPSWPVPGHAPGCVTLPLGGGRAAGGEVGTGRGFDASPLRPVGGAWAAPGLSVRRTGRALPVLSTGSHHVLEAGDAVRIVAPGEALPPPASPASLYPPWPYEGHAWGMAIDLDACIGCNACAAACQAENNVPVVGPEEVARGREMHWLRVDTYYHGAPAAPAATFQPVPCMHCERAPCEVVCPVNATMHDNEGLNVMVYNRCVGTRTCSNNCPYKVRRFNWTDRRRDLATAGRNPEVPLRPRGVIEKCTYCSHRIASARADAGAHGRVLGGDEVQTACQRACPTQAITFGDLNDPASAVSRARTDGRTYAPLGHLGTRPRTTYLARVAGTEET